MFAAKGDENMAKKRANGEGSIRKRSDSRWGADTLSATMKMARSK